MQLNEYFKVLSQRWWVIVLTALFAAASAFAFAKTQTPIYRSSVKLEVTGRIDYGQILAIGQLLRQIAARIETTAVANSVDQQLRLDLDTNHRSVLSLLRSPDAMSSLRPTPRTSI